MAHGLIGSRVDDGALKYIADTAAGDARRAIAILCRAADRVETEDLRDLTPDVVKAVIADAEANIRERRVRSLGTHQRLLYRIIEAAGAVDVGTLHARYEAQAQMPKAKSTRRRYLRSRRQHDLIETVGCGSGTRYRSQD